MGPEISNLPSSSSSESSMLLIPKLHDDGTNWSDYKPRIERAMGAKGLWRHVLGTAIAAKPFKAVNKVLVLADGKTEASEEQIESKEAKIEDFEKREYMAQHILMSSASTCLSSKLKNLKSSNEMFILADVMTKSTLYLLDAEEQLTSMKLSENQDSKTHLVELKQHFDLMLLLEDIHHQL